MKVLLIVYCYCLSAVYSQVVGLISLRSLHPKNILQNNYKGLRRLPRNTRNSPSQSVLVRSKDSMDHYFELGRQQLNDSMTEPQFRKLLSYVTAKINCGHTTIRPSKAWNKFNDTTRTSEKYFL